MNGVTIIEEHLCRVVELRQLIGLGTFVTLLCIGGLLFYVFMYKCNYANKDTKTVTLVCSALTVAMLAFFWVNQIYSYNDAHFEYTVEVDDSVALNDFFEKYEIISADGNRYRVKYINVD
jgi:hypothetical protein